MRELLFFSLACVLVVAACKKEQPCMDAGNPACENYDPCSGKFDQMSFFIEECYSKTNFGTFNSTYRYFVADYDTVFSGSLVRLSVSTNVDSAEWQIGTEATRRKGDTLVFGFSQFFSGYVTVTCYSTRIPDSLCFPQAKRTDTLVRHFYVGKRGELPLWGSYKGHDSDAPDKEYTIVLASDTIYEPVSSNPIYNAILNFPNSCLFVDGLQVGGRAFNMIESAWGTAECLSAQGYGILNGDTLTINYSRIVAYQSSIRMPVTFVGIKQH